MLGALPPQVLGVRRHAHWPRDRYLELSPRDWPATRARLDAAELESELGPLTIPPPTSEHPASR
jgi:hypothetical protein